MGSLTQRQTFADTVMIYVHLEAVLHQPKTPACKRFVKVLETIISFRVGLGKKLMDAPISGPFSDEIISFF